MYTKSSPPPPCLTSFDYNKPSFLSQIELKRKKCLIQRQSLGNICVKKKMPTTALVEKKKQISQTSVEVGVVMPFRYFNHFSWFLKDCLA